MRRISLVAALIFFASALVLQSQEQRPVLAFAGLLVRDGDVSAAELRVFENRITSVLVPFAEQNGFIVTIPRNRSEILELLLGAADATAARISRDLSADAVIAGELTRIDGMLFVDVRSIIVETMEIASLFSGEFSDFSAALGSAREIVSNLVEASTGIGMQGGLATEEISTESTIRSSVRITDITGIWNGDRGLGIVEIREDGTGIAHLNGSGTMRVAVSIDDNRFVIRQDEPNAPKMYMPVFPYTVAVQIVDIARPMRWVFTLNQNGDRLTGVKDTTFLQVDRGRVVWADNTYSREAVWTRRP